jgi:hypothetical protein
MPDKSIAKAPAAAAVASLRGLGRSITSVIANMKIISAGTKMVDLFSLPLIRGKKE